MPGQANPSRTLAREAAVRVRLARAHGICLDAVLLRAACGTGEVLLAPAGAVAVRAERPPVAMVVVGGDGAVDLLVDGRRSRAVGATPVSCLAARLSPRVSTAAASKLREWIVKDVGGRLGFDVVCPVVSDAVHAQDPQASTRLRSPSPSAAIPSRPTACSSRSPSARGCLPCARRSGARIVVPGVCSSAVITSTTRRGASSCAWAERSCSSRSAGRRSTPPPLRRRCARPSASSRTSARASRRRAPTRG